MTHHYYEWLLPRKSPFKSYEIEENNFGPLAHINIFVGSNNCGKSRFLRHLFIEDDLSYTVQGFSGETIRNKIQEVLTKYKLLFSTGIRTIDQFNATSIEESFQDHSEDRYLQSSVSVIEELSHLCDDLIRCSGASITFQDSIDQGGRELFRRNDQGRRIREVGKLLQEAIKGIEDRSISKTRRRVYIPILRGMRPFDHKNSEDIYHWRTQKDYFSNSLSENHTIFTGQNLYSDIRSKLLGEPQDRELIKDYEKFLSRKFFESREVTLIPKEKDDTVNIKIGTDPQLPLYHLGDGLQTLIILTYPMYASEEDTLFFIEEPDICLHPGYQRAFMETMLEHSQHQFFLTTHSNHFLDLTLDNLNTSIFFFEKQWEGSKFSFTVNSTSSAQSHAILRSLGAYHSSMFLTNSTIWVEGITDRLYIREFLKKYIEDKPELQIYREDLHYSFVEYQGSTLTHWTFDINDQDASRIKANYICAQALLIADGDISTKGNREEFYKEILEDRFYKLSCKEIENMLPEPIVHKLISDSLSEEHDISSIQHNSYSKLKTEGLGGYIDKTLGISKFGTEGTGTIKNKLTFCEKVIAIMREESNWELPRSVQKLCKAIFDHIKANNPNRGPSISQTH